MQIFFSILLCALLLLALPAEAAKAKAHAKTSATVLAQSQPPDTFLREVYDHYIGDYSKGLPLRTDKQLRKVFTPDLARAIEDDRRKAKGEVPNLDGDPFVDAQEWKIANMRIGIENETGAQATATARFENRGQEKQVVLLLVKGKSGWRVNEILMPSGSLRKLLSSPHG